MSPIAGGSEMPEALMEIDESEFKSYLKHILTTNYYAKKQTFWQS